MSRPEDFDIVDDDEGRPRRIPVWWGLLGAASVLIIAGIFAATTFSQRMADNAPAPDTAESTVLAASPGATATRQTPQAGQSPAQTPELTPTPVTDATATTTSAPSPTPSPATSPSPSPSPTPCPIPVADTFRANHSIQEMGCAQNQDRIVWSAWQDFQRGHMFWRSDTDQAFVLSRSGIYSPVDERWDGSPTLDRGTPPPGLLTPERGFGFVWSRSDEVFQLLGWATAPERGFCARIQDFEYGAMVASEAVPSCTPDNLYNYATSQDWVPINFRLTESGSWR